MAQANTEGFRWLPSYYEAIRDLPDAERLLLYDAITDFGFGNPVGDLPPLLNGYFRLIAPTLEKSVRFEEKQKANGSKGGRPSKTQAKPKTPLGLDEEKPSENLAVAVDVDVDVESAVEKADKPPRAPRSMPRPSVGEIRAYCEEKGYHVDAQAFFAYYESNGWRVGKNPMKSWQSALVTWERRGGESCGTDRNSANDPAGDRGETPQFNVRGRQLD